MVTHDNIGGGREQKGKKQQVPPLRRRVAPASVGMTILKGTESRNKKWPHCWGHVSRGYGFGGQCQERRCKTPFRQPERFG
jgi:hypothetical protein